MSDHYGNESLSASDQDESYAVTDTDVDADDQAVTEEMQFTNCKRPAPVLAEEIIIPPSDDRANVAFVDDTIASDYYPDYSVDTVAPVRSRCILMCMTLMLFLSAFVLLICFPLYIQQLNVNSCGGGGGGCNGKTTKHNAYGALLFVLSVITSAFALATVVASWCLKLDVKWYKLPLPWNRLTLISSIFGVATTICVLSSYQRVSCHLQDPLKGFSLAFAIVFYFFFCKRVMGLRKLFAATTAIVGLFISVDYGLCDRFRCRGVDVPTTETATPPVGWQGRSVWTIVYIVGVALWTLQYSLLEADICTACERPTMTPRTTLLATVSRIVSNATPRLRNSRPLPKAVKSKPNAMHVAMWTHAIALLVAIPIGWIDIIPAAGAITPIDEFWTTTRHTFLCHLNIQCNQVPEPSHAALDFLSNLTPASALYNETVRKLRRHRRQLSQRNATLNDGATTASPAAATHPHSLLADGTPGSANNETIAFMRKAHTEHYRKKYKGYVHNRHKVAALFGHHQIHHSNGVGSNRTPTKVAQLVVNTESLTDGHHRCLPLARYGLLLSVVYVLFAMSTFHFLFLTESAVFTTAVMAAALPVGGIFWSLFELTTTSSVATIVWAPEITGELICSMLGTPIVAFGIVLFASAHLNDLKDGRSNGGGSRSRYTSLSSSTSTEGDS